MKPLELYHRKGKRFEKDSYPHATRLHSHHSPHCNATGNVWRSSRAAVHRDIASCFFGTDLDVRRVLGRRRAKSAEVPCAKAGGIGDFAHATPTWEDRNRANMIQGTHPACGKSTAFEERLIRTRTAVAHIFGAEAGLRVATGFSSPPRRTDLDNSILLPSSCR